MSIEKRRRIANLVSNILNPFTVSLVAILFFSFESTPSIGDAIKWASILAAVSILPVFLSVSYFAHHEKIDGIFTGFRRQRTKIYLLAGTCALIGGVIITYFRAPLLLVSVFVSGLSAIAIFTGINLWWKISVHTAFVSALVTVLVILYGYMAAVAVVLILIVAWARVELAHHSLAQVATGALLAAFIVVVVFHFYGLL